MPPKLPKIVDGIEHWRCTQCPEGAEWHPASAFHKHKASSNGLSSWCAECGRRIALAKYQSSSELRERQKEAQARRRKRMKRKLRSGDRMFKRAIFGDGRHIEIPNEAVRSWVRDWIASFEGDPSRPDFKGYVVLAESAGVSERLIYRLLNENTSRVHLATADALARVTDNIGQLARMTEELGREGWNQEGDRFCRSCGTYWHPHCAKGLCQQCYDIDYRKGTTVRHVMLPRDRRRWKTRYYEDCVKCNDAVRTGRVHQGRGLCSRCFQQERKAGRLDAYPLLHEGRSRRGASKTDRAELVDISVVSDNTARD